MPCRPASSRVCVVSQVCRVKAPIFWMDGLLLFSIFFCVGDKKYLAHPARKHSNGRCLPKGTASASALGTIALTETSPPSRWLAPSSTLIWRLCACAPMRQNSAVKPPTASSDEPAAGQLRLDRGELLLRKDICRFFCIWKGNQCKRNKHFLYRLFNQPLKAYPCPLPLIRQRPLPQPVQTISPSIRPAKPSWILPSMCTDFARP